MSTRTRDLLAHACRCAAVGVLLISAGIAAPVMAADSAYTPTMKDWMSIQEAMHNYHEGLDKHDNKIMAKAFAEDGVLGLSDDRGMELRVVGRDKIAAGGLMGGGPPKAAEGAGAVPGAPGALAVGEPSPGFQGGPPAAAQGTPASGGAGELPAGMGNIWHFTGDDHYVFESPTRVTHYGYWLDMHPGEDRKSTIGIPGHYDDVLVKQKNGEWLFQQRQIIVGRK